jgi:hypothetical protein
MMTSSDSIDVTSARPQPNRFTFIDRNSSTRIVFLPQVPDLAQTDDPTNASQLEYQGPEGQFTFQGDQIEKQASPLGRLITVTLQPDADAGELNLTLVLPPVNLGEVRQQGFTTLAIKTRSRGRWVANPQPGAELAYRVVSLQGIAAFVPPNSNSMPESVQSVTQVSLSVLESFPPQLQITASGTVPTAGWTNPQLLPRTYIQAPLDGIYDFDFVADSPEGVVAQVVTSISANYLWQSFPSELKGVRIHAATNEQVALLGVAVSV